MRTLHAGMRMGVAFDPPGRVACCRGGGRTRCRPDAAGCWRVGTPSRRRDARRLLAGAGGIGVCGYRRQQGIETCEPGIQAGAPIRSGKRLFVSVQGSGRVHAISADTGADKEIIMPGGDTVVELACHPQKGPVFVAMSRQNSIAVIDPDAGTALPTSDPALATNDMAHGRLLYVNSGRFLTVDSHNGSTLYAAFPTGGGVNRFGVENPSGMGIVKFSMNGKSQNNPSSADFAAGLLPVGRFQPLARTRFNSDAVPLGQGSAAQMRVSADGKSLGVAAGNGINLHSADDVKSRIGAVKCPEVRDFAFHPC